MSAGAPVDQDSLPSAGRLDWRRATVVFLAVALAYAAGAALSWQTFGAGPGPAFFPPAGVTVAAMLLTRRSAWPVIVAAVVVAEVAVDLAHGATGWSAAGFALANSIEPIVGATVTVALCGGSPDLRLRSDLIRFVGGACVVGPFVGGLIGASAGVLAAGQVWWPGVLLHWWAGDAVGALVVGAPILLWPLQKQVLRSRGRETVSVLVLTAALSVVAFWFNTPPGAATASGSGVGGVPTRRDRRCAVRGGAGVHCELHDRSRQRHVRWAVHVADVAAVGDPGVHCGAGPRGPADGAGGGWAPGRDQAA